MKEVCRVFKHKYMIIDSPKDVIYIIDRDDKVKVHRRLMMFLYAYKGWNYIPTNGYHYLYKIDIDEIDMKDIEDEEMIKWVRMSNT